MFVYRLPTFIVLGLIYSDRLSWQRINAGLRLCVQHKIVYGRKCWCLCSWGSVNVCIFVCVWHLTHHRSKGKSSCLVILTQATLVAHHALEGPYKHTQIRMHKQMKRILEGSKRRQQFPEKRATELEGERRKWRRNRGVGEEETENEISSVNTLPSNTQH